MNAPKSLMTLYQEGALISRELKQMMVDYAAEARFDLEMTDESELWIDTQQARRPLNFNGR
jgi:hypothetical protein